MPCGDKNKPAKVDHDRSSGETADNNETFGEALSKAGFKPAKVGRRKIVSRGKRRETLKKRNSENPEK
ncbi:hypothetical protein FA04_32910 (plasmid) [Ensifer adhaerens]|nr:hypothetical protein FA04_32910 [Ensifer adhaerens]KDP73010.1 hypothetical protein FA04_14520 [Ensifer adhaerens]